MNREDKIRTYLKQNGFKPRNDKDIKKYIQQLNTRLGKKGKKLYIENMDDDINIFIGEKIETIKRTKVIPIRVTIEEEEKYKKLAENKNTNLSKLIRDLLDKECKE